MSLKGTCGAESRSSASFAWMRSWDSSGNAPVSMNDATWPTFIAAPFMFPSTSRICSAASAWRRDGRLAPPVLVARQVRGLRGVVARGLAAGQPGHLRRAPDPPGGDRRCPSREPRVQGYAAVRCGSVMIESFPAPRAAMLRDGRVLESGRGLLLGPRGGPQHPRAAPGRAALRGGGGGGDGRAGRGGRAAARRSPGRERSSASGSTTARTPRRRASTRPRRPRSSPSTPTRWRRRGRGAAARQPARRWTTRRRSRS